MKGLILFIFLLNVNVFAQSPRELFRHKRPHEARIRDREFFRNSSLPKAWSLQNNLVRAVSSILSTGVNEDWVARFDNPGYSYDDAQDIAVGTSGNVYVTGSRETIAGEVNFVTVKYNSAGEEQWAVRLPNNSGSPVGIALDNFENVYVAGSSFLAVKYNSDGEQQWVGQYDDAPNGKPRFARALALLGNEVYVTGSIIAFSDSFSTAHENFLTVKFDVRGRQAWATTYDGFQARDDRATAIAATPNGVFVTGLTRGRFSESDYFVTLGYNPGSGAQLWVAKRSGANSFLFNVNAIAAEGAYVYVTGYQSITIKYNALTGEELWVRGGCCLNARAITLDAVGNVYITGEDFVTRKFNADGEQQWSTNINRDGDAYDIVAFDSFIYVTGRGRDFGSNKDYDYVTIQYQRDTGQELWVARYNGLGQDDSDDVGLAIAVSSGNVNRGAVYVTGVSEGTLGDFDYATIRYGGNGTQVWAARHNEPGNSGDFVNAAVVDADGNVYVTGRSRTIGRGNVYLTVKYNSAGTRQWSATYSGLGTGFNIANDIAVDLSGNVYVTGLSAGAGDKRHTDAVTIKYAGDGSELWVARFDGQDHGDDAGNAIVVDDVGNVYVTGYSFGTTTKRDYLTIKYDTFGQQQWLANYNYSPFGFGDLDDEAADLAVDGLGNVYVTGKSTSQTTSEDYATIKYNTFGVQQWAARYDFSILGSEPFITKERAVAIAIDGVGNVYVTGQGEALHDKRDLDYVTIKYNPFGATLWVSRYDVSFIDNSDPSASVLTDDRATALAVDVFGNVYVTGMSGILGDRDNGDVLSNFDYTTIKYNSFGTQQWVAKYNGPADGPDIAYAIILDGFCNVYVTGASFTHLLDDIISETYRDIHDYATVKYNCAGVQQWVARYNDPLNGNDVAVGIGLDRSGHVYVAGSSDSLLTYLGDVIDEYLIYSDYVAIRYSQDQPPTNKCPIVVFPLPRVVLNAGGSPYVRDLNKAPAVFSDPESDPLTYSTTSSDSSVAVGSITGNVLKVAPVDSGLATIFITAEDGKGGMALDTLVVSVVGHVTSVKNGSETQVAKEYKLYQSYPNPFNPETVIAYDIRQAGEVTLKVYNVVGQEVRTLVKKFQSAGSYKATWDGRDHHGVVAPSGIYFYRLETASYVKTRKMSLLR